MELAEQKFRTETASTEGMEELFGTGTEDGTATVDSSEPIAGEAVEIISTDEAARRLGISTRAVLKRLKTGALKGNRDTSKKKAEWQVYWYGTTEPNQPERPHSSEQRSERTANGTEPLRYLMEQNTKLVEQNQALVHRNGYLEALLSEREQEIKLLTDTAAKPHLFTRLIDWLVRPRA